MVSISTRMNTIGVSSFRTANGLAISGGRRTTAGELALENRNIRLLCPHHIASLARTSSSD
jgi:hypothetical protein